MSLIILGTVLLLGLCIDSHREEHAEEIQHARQIRRVVRTAEAYTRHVYHNPTSYGQTGYKPGKRHA